MKNLAFYKTALNCDTKDQVFEYFIANLQKSIADWAKQIW